jgi:ADP-L-glycero-D-manno-heptose 6-epimerase
MMKKEKEKLIIVTGGAGFIGSSVIRHLNNSGTTSIVVVDELGKTEKWKNLVGKLVEDVISKHQLFEWLKDRSSQIQAFIHLGACSSTVETDATYLLENNYRYSMRLAEYAIRHGHRFIYASSAATYGDGSRGFSDHHDELESLHPLNMYGFSKHLFDLWIKSQGHLDKVVGLKYFNVFGPNEYHKGRMASAITHFLPSAKRDGVIKLFKSDHLAKFGHGDQKRDHIYVMDAAKMTCAFLNNSATGIYNIGTGIATTWNEMANAVFKAIKKNPHIQYIDMPADLVGKYQDYTCADMRKTRQVLKEAAQCRPFENCVIEYVCDYLTPGKTW